MDDVILVITHEEAEALRDSVQYRLDTLDQDHPANERTVAALKSVLWLLPKVNGKPSIKCKPCFRGLPLDTRRRIP